ncbi:hypothetical protein M1N47_03525 [Dehalococcoidia bacterium]|nr:hypothetical protein [Dehalococcoidia bacterium]
MPVELERSLIQMGDALGITIPKGWLRYYKLKKKDRLILIANSEIIIRRLEEKREDRAEEPNR